MRDWIRLFIIEFKNLALNPSHYLAIVLFFVASITLIPLTLGIDPDELRIISTSVIWILFLLVVLLVVQNLFTEELNNGLIEQIIIANKSLSVWIAVKVLVYFLVIGLPLIFISPLLAVSLYFDSSHLKDFYLILFLLTPTLFLLCSVGASFSVALKDNFILLSMISIPLCIPFLILASSALEAFVNNLDALPLIKLLIASIILTLGFCPWISGKILRVLFQ